MTSEVMAALGINQWPVSYWQGKPITSVPPSGSVERLEWLAENWVRDKAIHVFIGVGGGNYSQKWKERQGIVFEFLKNHPEDFQIVWQDPEANQWKPENNPLEFYR